MTAPDLDRRHWWHEPAAVGADHHGVGVLDDDVSLRLLGTQSIGRLGFSAQALPVIFPVNFVLVDGNVVFRTEVGQKLEAARQRSVACFEVDGFDGFAHTGWSVLVTGRLEVVEGEALQRLGRLPLQPWAIDNPSHVVSLSTEVVSGRTIVSRPM